MLVFLTWCVPVCESGLILKLVCWSSISFFFSKEREELGVHSGGNIWEKELMEGKIISRMHCIGNTNGNMMI